MDKAYQVAYDIFGCHGPETDNAARKIREAYAVDVEAAQITYDRLGNDFKTLDNMTRSLVTRLDSEQ